MVSEMANTTLDYLAKMHLIEHDLVWMCDAPKACSKCGCGENGECEFVVPLRSHSGFDLATEVRKDNLDVALRFIDCCLRSLLLGASLPY
jgi:hypothetical protein